jgi:acyl-CoA synthetase (AMP-forming)/AMP-acid ligase II
MPAPVWTEVSTIGDLLVRAAQRKPDVAALILSDRRVSYRALLEGALEIARGLAGLGVRPGAHVGVLLPNGIEIAEALFGIALYGCVGVPLNVRHKTVELGYMIRNAELAAVLTSSDPADPADFPAVLTAAIASAAASAGEDDFEPAGIHRVLLRGQAQSSFIDRATLQARAASVTDEAIEHARRGVRLRDTGLIIYTSGTTANPKGCMLSHEAATRGPVERARHRLASGGHDVTWGGGPLFHIGSLAPFLGSVGVAGTYLTDLYFEPGRALELMAAEGVTLAWPWFSAIVQGIIDHPDFYPARLGTLRHMFLIAPDALVARVQRLLPQTEVIQACGMTETAGIFALMDRDAGTEVRNTTQGKASPGVQVRIVDPETDHDLSDGSMGEIWVRGYCVMDGYWRDPQKTAASIDSEGWFRTGDLYVRHPDGSLVFKGRLKDMLKVGGENVATMEVEAFLCSHPDVKLVEVVGRPDARLDEVPVAFVELRPGSTVGPEQLIEFCRGQIANYKIPRAIYLVAPGDWPMSTTKVDKRALRARLAAL